jgi:hypothetical protein
MGNDPYAWFVQNSRGVAMVALFPQSKQSSFLTVTPTIIIVIKNILVDQGSTWTSAAK